MNPKHITYIYLAILLLGTFLPINGPNSALNNNYTLNIRWDYLLHALVYLPLPALAFATVRIRINSPEIRVNSRSTKKRVERINYILILLIGLLIAAGLEALQMFVPYRTFNINDLIANGVGVLLGWIIMVIVRKKLAFA